MIISPSLPHFEECGTCFAIILQQPMRAALITTSCILLISSMIATKSARKPFSKQYCNERFHYCLDYPASMFGSAYFSPAEDTLLFTTLDTLGEVSVLSHSTAQKLDSYKIFEERMRQLTAKGGEANILSIINGDDYYEVNFLYDGHWYHQKAGFYRTYDVLFSIQVPVNRPELMMRLKQDVKFEFL